MPTDLPSCTWESSTRRTEADLRPTCKTFAQGSVGISRLELSPRTNHRNTVQEVVEGVPVTRLGTAFTLAGAPVCPSMAFKIRDAKSEIVHIHLPNPTAVLAYLVSGHRGPVVISWHSDIIRQKRLAALYEPFQRILFHRCPAVIAASPQLVASSPSLHRYRDRCWVIPYGIPLEPFCRYDSGEVEAIRGRYGPRIALYVGRLVYYKGLEYLIAAMPDIRARLLIIGDGPLRKQLESKVRGLGLTNRVVFLGEVPNAIPFYHSCDVFVLPSVARSEAFGLVQLEAMACGKPVVNTRLASGVPFVSVDRLTGITVPPANPGALADALNSLLDNAARRATYSRAAGHRVRQEFSLEKMVERTLALYGAVMSGNFEALAPRTDSLQKPAQVFAGSSF